MFEGLVSLQPSESSQIDTVCAFHLANVNSTMYTNYNTFKYCGCWWSQCQEEAHMPTLTTAGIWQVWKESGLLKFTFWSHFYMYMWSADPSLIHFRPITLQRLQAYSDFLTIVQCHWLFSSRWCSKLKQAGHLHSPHCLGPGTDRME